MSYPAEAFKCVLADEAEIGSLFLSDGQWGLKCCVHKGESSSTQVLWLYGVNAGELTEVPWNAPSLAIAEGYGFEVRLSHLRALSSDRGHRKGAVEITSDGKTNFWGMIPGLHGGLLAFRHDGHSMNRNSHNEPLVSRSYELWLQKDGAAVGSEPLFTVSPP